MNIQACIYFIGISLSPQPKEGMRIAILKKQGKAIQIETFLDLPYSEEGVNQLYKLPYFSKEFKTSLFSGLSGNALLVRKIHFPLKERKKVLSALPFQLEALLPYPPQSAVICPLFLTSKLTTSVTVLATTEEKLKEHFSSLKTLGLKTENISADPLALARFAHWEFPEEDLILTIHCKTEELLYVLSKKEEILLSQTYGCDLSLKEIEKLSIFLKQKGAIDDQTPWLLTGSYQDSSLFSPFFLGKQLELQEQEKKHHAISIGYALGGNKKDAFSAEFNQKHFSFDHLIKRRNSWALIYLFSCLICALFLFVLNQGIFKAKTKALVEKISKDLSFNSPLSSSLEEIANALFEWEKELNKQKQSFPFLPTTPKLSDVLAWLSTHPSFTLEDGNPKPGIEIQSIHYELVKYPKIQESKHPYLAKVELEFKTKIPRLARDFHETLLKGDPLVNTKKEIRWQVNDQQYFTSFELNQISP